MVTPRGIEPLLPPWKGGVLTAWPRGLVFCSLQCIIHLFTLSFFIKLATQKGLEPSTSGVTGRHSNQLSYWAIIWWKQQGSNLWPSACKADALPAELCFHIKWWPLGESNPCYHRERVVSWPLDQGAIKWSFMSESNQQPADYKSAALPLSQWSTFLWL